MSQDYSDAWSTLKLHPLQSFEWSKVYAGSSAVFVSSIPLMVRIGTNPISKAPFASLLKVTDSQIPDTTALKKIIEQLTADYPGLSHIVIEPEGYIDALDDTADYSLPPAISRYTVVNDLTPSGEDILANSSKSHRQNARKSLKRGLQTIEFDTGDEAIDRFCAVMNEIQTSQSFIQFHEAHYRKVWAVLSASDMATIIIGSFNGQDIGVYMIARAHGAAYQLYGGRNETGRREKLAQGLAYKAMLAAKSRGCNSYDMWGIGAYVDDELDKTDEKYGIGKFKCAFGGNKVTNQAAKVIIVSPAKYKTFLGAKKVRNKLTFIQKKLS